ncbi:glutamate racemase [Sphingobacterium lactis]|uniref:glutamate racemase n=1 Tax=Sphingobacterium lactis TaxID=797291 RepID=UPI003DA54869
MSNQHLAGPIGIFDSGYGGLTVFQEILKKLPDYDYIYLGDNARVPYGTRSFETVYEYTKECVFKLFDLGCNLVILACNTASAKALRTIQQHDLPEGKKVLGVIRPTSEVVDQFTKTKQVGILATQGTVNSESYLIEINKFHPDIQVFQHACPFWVPLVENNELDSEGAHYFIQQDIQQLLQDAPQIDSILLACTHYPLLLPIIRKYVPEHINIISQGALVADSLEDYLKRHPEVEEICSKGKQLKFFTTDDPMDFNEKAEIFFGKRINSKHLKVQP